MLVVADIGTWFATAVGSLTGSIAIGGFLAHIGPALSRASDAELRAATVIGGMAGLVVGGVVVVLSAYFG
ncbi:MAG: hypothetical protein WBL45_05875 [Solirubrobacterales bacterium]